MTTTDDALTVQVLANLRADLEIAKAEEQPSVVADIQASIDLIEGLARRLQEVIKERDAARDSEASLSFAHTLAEERAEKAEASVATLKAQLKEIVSADDARNGTLAAEMGLEAAITAARARLESGAVREPEQVACGGDNQWFCGCGTSNHELKNKCRVCGGLRLMKPRSQS